jgi:acetyltransferase-like isoleucine patch superfamily enzyme
MFNTYMDSPLKGYQDLVVGEPGLIPLLEYELLSIPFTVVPGALGYFLRGIFARRLFKTSGAKSVYGSNIRIFGPKRISIGRNVMISDGVRLDAKGAGRTGINIGDKVLIGTNTVLRSRFGGTIDLGEKSSLGDNCIVASRESTVTIGSKVLVGAYCYIMGGPPHEFEDSEIPIDDQGYHAPQDVTIEDDVWLGARVTVMYGVTIGCGSVIGAGSLVNKDIPEMSVAVGVPAKVKKRKNPKKANSCQTGQ